MSLVSCWLLVAGTILKRYGSVLFLRALQKNNFSEAMLEF